MEIHFTLTTSTSTSKTIKDQFKAFLTFNLAKRCLELFSKIYSSKGVVHELRPIFLVFIKPLPALSTQILEILYEPAEIVEIPLPPECVRHFYERPRTINNICWKTFHDVPMQFAHELSIEI